MIELLTILIAFILLVIQIPDKVLRYLYFIKAKTFLRKYILYVIILNFILILLSEISSSILSSKIKSMSEDIIIKESQLKKVENELKESGVKIEKFENQLKENSVEIQQLEHQSAPRSLDSKTISGLIHQLQVISLKSSDKKISITVIMGDQEAFTFGKQLEKIFAQSGWEVIFLQSVYTVPMQGLVFSGSTSEPSEDINSLNLAFARVGVKNFGYNHDIAQDPNELKLIVGSKF